MTISSTLNRTEDAGNGVTTAFAFPYPYTDTGDLRVILVVDSTGVGTLQTITTHYTVSAPGASGTVTMVTEPATGETLIILRAVPQTQSSDLITGGNLPADTLEGNDDRSALFAQDLGEKAGRALTLPEDYLGAVLAALTNPAAGQILQVNAGATGIDWVDPLAASVVTSESGTFTATLTGCTTSPTAECAYQRVGNIVTIRIPYLVGTSNTNACSITGVPASLNPTFSAGQNAATIGAVLDNGAYVSAVFFPGTSGVITISATLDDSDVVGFTTSGVKGIGFCTITYSMT